MKMEKLNNEEISMIIDKLTVVLKLRKEVSGAYLFGSILERSLPDSDIDVGLVLAPAVTHFEKEAEMFL